MDALLPIAAKSFLVAGVALMILKLADKRSASQRSWIAHLGLAAALLLPFASMALPPLEVQRPAFLAPAASEVAAAPAVAPAPAAAAKVNPKLDTESATTAGSFPPAAGAIDAARQVDWAFWLYAAPAALLLLLTLIALGRLFALRARASVLVEPHCLTALARAQHRMGFKHGTALLTSDELPSPISWGLMRPVILLNSEAAKSHDEAEAIIAHELAHVAGLDWAKLMLSRITVALFWFNPFVWLLAREAHQLREEAADDAVLGADIEDTDYARLLVGVARHECRGLLIGAHGVAPGRNSLSRRVRRVLDSSLARGPTGRAFALGMFAGAAMLAAPLAALTLTTKPAEPAAPVAQAPADPRVAVQASDPQTPYYASEGSADAIEDAIVDHNTAGWDEAERRELAEDLADAREELREARESGASAEAVRAAIANAVAVSRKASRIKPETAYSAMGVTPQYAAAIRAASPRLARVGYDDLVAFKVHGVSPAYVRDLEASGLRGLSPDQLTTAAVHGVNARYVRSLAAVGYPNLSYKNVINMRIHDVTPEFVRSVQRRGAGNPSASQLIQMRIHGTTSRSADHGPDVDIDIDDDS